MPQSQIIGLGGGGFSMETNPLLDLYILSASAVKNPKICFLPTASADNSGYAEQFVSTFNKYPCRPTYLNIFSPRIRDLRKFLLSSDIIYVGGGNTKSMLALWREWGIDQILKEAYEKGIVLAGVSAGFVCWFKQCITDSIPGKYSMMECLGFLEGSGCPHYNGQPFRPQAYKGLLQRDEILSGFAADDCVGLHFIDGKFVRAISSDPDVSAYQLYKNEHNKVIEKKIHPEFLGSEESIKKYINPLFEEGSTS